MEKGEERVRLTQEKSVRAILENTEFSAEKIADMVGVPVSFVEEVRETLQPK